MALDTGLLVARIVGSVFAGIYGLYATLNEFHETRHGKKFLSKKGKWGISLLLLATLINVGSDSIKQKVDLNSARAESKKRDAETARIQEISSQVGQQITKSAEVSSNLKDALTLLSNSSQTITKNMAETERLLNPIQDSMSAEAYFRIPTDQPLVEPFAKRARNPLTAVSSGQPGFPGSNPATRDNELDLHNFLTTPGDLQIVFTRAAGLEAVVFRLKCDNRDTAISWDKASNLSFECNTVAERQTNDGSFRSYTDLLRSKVTITPSFQNVAKDGSHLTFMLDKIVIHLGDPNAHTWSGRMISLDHIRQATFEGAPAFTAKISLQPNFTTPVRLSHLQ